MSILHNYSITKIFVLVKNSLHLEFVDFFKKFYYNISVIKMKNKRKEDLKIAIVGGDEQSLPILSKELYQFMQAHDLYIFDVLLGNTGKPSSASLGRLWAEEVGMPTKTIYASTPEKLMNRLLYEADYIFFVYHNEQWLKNLIMRYRMTGKHGTVIQSPYKVAENLILSSPLPTLHCAAADALERHTPAAAHFLLPDDEDYYNELFLTIENTTEYRA